MQTNRAVSWRSSTSPWTIVFFLLAAGTCQWSYADHSSVPVQSFLRSVSAITSFDVVLQDTLELHYIWEPLEGEPQPAPGVNPRGRFREYHPGETPYVRQRTTRQVWENSGRRRVDVLESDEYDIGVQVFDGEVIKTLNWRQLHGSVRPETPRERPLTEDNRYDAYFLEAYAGGTFDELLASRPKVSVVDHGDHAVLQVPQQPGNFYPRFSFELRLNRQYGYLPDEISVRIGNRLSRKHSITKFKLIGEQVWVPVEAKCELYSLDQEQLMSTFTLTVDEEHSTWNAPVSGDLFALDFPAGSQVLDRVASTISIAGDRDPNQNLANHRQKAMAALPLDDQGKVVFGGTGTPIENATTRVWVLVGSLLVAASVVVVILSRNKVRTTTK